MRRCYIVGAGDNSGTIFVKKENDFVIAADGGLKILEQLGIEPDAIIGDFDSLGFIPKGKNVIRHKVEKDDTDMMLSVEYAHDLGYNDIVIFGGTGGRVDHTFANVSTMLWASRHGIRISMVDETNIYRVITNESITLDAKRDGDLSVFAFDKAEDVCITGAKYTASNMALTNDNPTAVSNSFIGKEVTISVGIGSLLIITKK